MDKDKLENGVSFQRADGFADGIVRSIKKLFDRDPTADSITPEELEINVPEANSIFNAEIRNIGNLQEKIKTHHLHDFGALLQDDYTDKFFAAGSHILTVKNSDGNIAGYNYFVTNQDLIVRKDKYGKLACDVIDNADLIGEGGQASVYSIAGSIKRRYTVSGPTVQFEYGESKRIAKVAAQGKRNTEEFINRINHEADLTKQCSHLNSRHTFFGAGKNGRNVAGMTMQRFGLDLLELINQDSESKFFTIDDRFQLTIKVLEALQQQMHQREIVHRDIKADNICAWYDEYNWHVDIIDLGGARYHNENDRRYPGTLMYAPYETLHHKIVNESSDIFSIGIVIALLWRDLHEMTLDDDGVYTDREQNDWNIPLELFDGIADLPPIFSKQIQSMLEKMLSKDQSQRPSLDACISDFKTIYQVYKHDKTASEDIAVRVTANIQANAANALFAEYANQIATADNINKFNHALHQIYNNLPAPAGGSMIFASEQNSYYLAPCGSKQDFINKTETLFTSYQNTLDSLKKLKNSFSNLADEFRATEYGSTAYSDLKKHMLELTKFIGNMTDLKLDLDMLNTETAHMNRKLAKMQEARKGLEISLRLDASKHSDSYPRNSISLSMRS